MLLAGPFVAGMDMLGKLASVHFATAEVVFYRSRFGRSPLPRAYSINKSVAVSGLTYSSTVVFTASSARSSGRSARLPARGGPSASMCWAAAPPALAGADPGSPMADRPSGRLADLPVDLLS